MNQNFAAVKSAVTGALVAAGAVLFAPNLLAAQADISSTPLSAINAAQVKPNVMLLMDTSTSMSWTHMPDEVETDSRAGVTKVGYKSSQCNSLYYNPATLYALPKKPDGSLFQPPSFNGAFYGGYAGYYVPTGDSTDLSTVNLATSFQAYDQKTLRYAATTPDALQAAYYYIYSGTATLNYASSPCADDDSDPTRVGTSLQFDTTGGTWTRVLLNNESAAQRANFAIWYSYYRTRIALTKSAASLAFTPLTDSFRIGFITVEPAPYGQQAINPSKYVEIHDFDTTQRSTWFTKLFSQVADGASPAREGLARVGRHYAGKHDSINTGMTGDPVQYYCQQNFTILTTDGYWNAQTESPGGGPLALDGVSKVASLTNNPDGTLTGPTGNSPRPIFDGASDATQVTEDNEVSFGTAACGSFAMMSTLQLIASTTQNVQSTTQMLQSQRQTQQSTLQILASTSQVLQSNSGLTQTTVQQLATTTQALQSTRQVLANTSQPTQSTSQVTTSTNQNLQTTMQNLQSTSQNVEVRTIHTQTITVDSQSSTQTTQSTQQTLASTSYTTQSSSQNFAATHQALQSTNQNLANTAQTTQTTSQQLQSTSQALQSTSQNIKTSTASATQYTSQTQQGTSSVTQSTSQPTVTTTQVMKRTGRTDLCGESCVPQQSCVPSGGKVCTFVGTGPTLVASCTPSSATAGNNWTTTTCYPSSTGPTVTSSCTPQAANSGNNYTTTSCGSNTSGPTAVASCTNDAPTAANNYTTTTCQPSSTPLTGVPSCTPDPASSSNGYVTTVCALATTGPTAVGSCTAAAPTAANQYTTTTCGGGGTTTGPAPSCTADANTTCSMNNTGPTPVASCVASGPDISNGYTTTTCSFNDTSATPVASCVPTSPDSSNAYTATICTNSGAGPTGVPSCAAGGPTVGNGYTTTTCGNNTQNNVPVATCTPAAADGSNNYTATTCSSPVVTTNVPVANCSQSSASAGNSYVSITCSSNDTSATAVQSCTPDAPSAGNNYTATVCSINNTGPTNVQSCAASPATSGNGWVSTTCTPVSTGPTGVASCNNDTANVNNNWVNTVCSTNNTGPSPVSGCVASGPDAGNGYTTTTCNPSGTGWVDVDNCIPVAAGPGNGYTATVCSTRVISSGPVASCTPDAPTAANGHQRTTCSDSQSRTPVQICTPGPDVSCDVVNTGPTPVQSCTPSAASSGNAFTTTTCSTNNTSNVPVATCVAAAADPSNAWTTMACSNTTTGPSGTGSCTPVPASAGNNFVETLCTNNTNGPTAVQSCTPDPATSANNWTATTCGMNAQNNVGVQSCTPSGPTSANNWTTTTCPPAAVTNNVPVGSCFADPASAANQWVETTCPTPIVQGPTGVASCTPDAASAANNWTATSCTNNTVGPTSVNSCTADPATAANNWTATICGTAGAGNVPVQSCTPSGPTPGNGYTTTTCTPVINNNVPVASCTAGPGTAANSWVTTTCPTPIATGPTPVATCTPATPDSTNNFTLTVCNVVPSTPTGVASCTPDPATAANNWIETICTPNNTPAAPVQTCTASGPTSANGYTTTTCPPPVVFNGPVPSCTSGPASAGNQWTTTSCSANSTGPVQSSNCVAEGPTAANNYTTTTCASLGAQKITYQIIHSITTSQLSGGLVTHSVTQTDPPTPPADLSPNCDPNNTPPLPTPNPVSAGNGNPGPQAPCGPTWPCSTVTANPQGGSINSLADVAQYYYVNDLRAGSADPQFAKHGVPAVGTGPEDDRLTTQHMTTFTIGLGVSGTLTYQANYRSLATTTGDFAGIRNGTISWPIWPDTNIDYSNFDNWNSPNSIDDFWHTAVNGRGQYFSANNPSSVVSGLAGALASVQTRLSTGAAVGASNLQPVVGDNFVYLGSYKTQEWSGDVTASTLNLTTGTVDPTTIWSASAQLALVTKDFCDNRQIYLMRGSALVNFSWNSQTCDVSGNPTGAGDTGLNTAEMANFDASKIALLSQRPSMTDGSGITVDQVTPAAGANLVNFLRGQRGLEGFEANSLTKLYRPRASSLGDIVGGQPVYVSKPTSTYADSGYAAFATANSSRTPMVYVAANDGMLHAFYGSATANDPLGGQEAWAIVPSAMLPNMYKLADNNYKNTHQFYVDGTPTVADVRNSGNSWRTMLVGGFNAGGKGYYAVDVTNPTTPVAMWEFKLDPSNCNGVGSSSDCNLGLSFGKPIVTKIKDSGYSAEGRWVVLVSSGYNNVNGTSNDGNGYLYVLDANTGVILYKISTGAGNASTPSNLGQLNAYVDDASVNNLALRAYGTDMLGDIFSFDFVNNTSVLVGQAKDAGGTPQPITTRPELAELNGKAMVFVGTGRLLGTTDSTNLQTQSIYGIVDPLSSSNPEYTDLRTALKTMVMTTSGNARTIACASNCSSAKGWFVDLPDSGERVNVDMQLALSTLVVGSNVPTTDVCDSGGYSWLSYLDIATGEANGSFGDTPGPNSHVSERADNSLIVGLTVIRLPDRTFKTELSLSTPVGTSGGGLIDTRSGYFPTPKPSGKRISWRAINQDQ